ncbi:MAG: peptidoglycan bridge formation glycyltransferase FemA/FemB family protein [Bacteroidales bacterium]|jgi:lipid II:glycine glycyltransferase (peptidoglycan interpeptide bridge formation enzyme)
MKIISNNEIPVSLWNEFISRSPYESPFQSYEFYKFINSLPDFSAEAFAVSDKNELLILAVVVIKKESGIKSFFSSRGIIYGGPLIPGKDPEKLKFLIERIINHLRKKIIYLETRNYFDYSSYSDIFDELGWSFLPYLNFVINLKNKSLDDILSGMKYNRRREIRLTLQSGVTFKECKSEEELQTLYKILSDLYTSRVKLPLPKYHFFKALWLSKVGKVFIVMHDSSIIGGSFCIIRPQTSIYTMYYCGFREYDRKIFPTHIAVIAAIDYGIQNKLKYLDFMGAGIKDKEYGVRKYKQEFGGELNEYGRYRYITQPLWFKAGQFGLKLMKKFM